MRVRFTRGFQSMHTGEVFYEQGAVADFAGEHAQALIAEGAAARVPLVAREGQAAPTPPTHPPPKKPSPQRRHRA